MKSEFMVAQSTVPKTKYLSLVLHMMSLPVKRAVGTLIASDFMSTEHSGIS